MADIINLRQARKQKVRADKEAKAEQNRARFGRTKHERAKEGDRRKKLEQHLDQHKLEQDDP